MDIDTNNPNFLEVIKMLSNPIRVKILTLTLHGELSQTMLAKNIGCSTSAISQHTALLQQNGLLAISIRDRGKKYVKGIHKKISIEFLPAIVSK